VGYELLGKPSNKNGYKIDPTELTFMHAASKTYSTASWIKRVRTWGKALKGSEMAELAGCKLGAFSKKKCDSPAVYNVRYGGTPLHVQIVAHNLSFFVVAQLAPAFRDLNTSCLLTLSLD